MWELDCNKSWVPKNWCFSTVVLEKTLESPLHCKEIQPFWRISVLGVHWKDWCWSWNSNTLATSCEELTHWKSPWCWERLKVGGEGDDRGWDGWMAPPIQWRWVWFPHKFIALYHSKLHSKKNHVLAKQTCSFKISHFLLGKLILPSTPRWKFWSCSTL